MRLDLEKIFENAFVLDLKYQLTTRDRLDKSFESFFATFNKDPYELIELMDTAVRDELKKRALTMLSSIELTEQDKENFEPFTLQDLMPVNKIKKNGTTKNESID